MLVRKSKLRELIKSWEDYKPSPDAAGWYVKEKLIKQLRDEIGEPVLSTCVFCLTAAPHWRHFFEGCSCASAGGVEHSSHCDLYWSELIFNDGLLNT